MSRAGSDSYSVAQRTCLLCCASVLALISLVSYWASTMPWPPNVSCSASRDFWHRQNLLWPCGPDYAHQAAWPAGPVCSGAKPLQEFSRNIQSLLRDAPEEVCQQFPRLLGRDHDQVTDLDAAFETRSQFLRTTVARNRTVCPVSSGGSISGWLTRHSRPAKRWFTAQCPALP